MNFGELFDDPRHRESEALAFEAEQAERRNDPQAARLWARAAVGEEALALAIPLDMPKARSIFGISAVVLHLRARQWVGAKRVASRLLSRPDALLPDGARDLEALLQQAIRELSATEVKGVTRLREVTWSTKYDSDIPSLVETFYLPAMQPAVRYDRSTGYYSAQLLTIVARGVESLVHNSGRMRLIVGCTLGPHEVEAIARGAALRDMIDERVKSWPLEPSEDAEVDALALLAWMVAHDVLDVRVAVPCGVDRRPIVSDGIFHEKAGIVEDAWGDRIAFQGSVNETLMGWGGTAHGNWESFSVFTSWGPGAAYVDAEAASFLRLWDDQAKHARVLDVPSAMREDLLRFLPPSDQKPTRLLAPMDPPADETHEETEIEQLFERVANVLGTEREVPLPPLLDLNRDDVTDAMRDRFWAAVRNAPASAKGGAWVGEATAAVTPWPHQHRAFERMYSNWPPKLLIADEVGLGKTIQAGLVFRQAWLSGRAKRILILAPKSVLSQWQIELREKFNLNWPIYDGHDLHWFPSYGTEEVSRKVGAGAWPDIPCVLASSQLVRRKSRAATLVAAEPWDLVVLDEAHHARRKGAGSASEEGPNRLLSLMRQLVPRTAGLVLMTATPMQVHPVELWDLLSLLGLPSAWTPDVFERFFELASQATVSPQDFEFMARLFRNAEATFGKLPDDTAKRWLPSALASKNILKALRDDAESPRRQLAPDRIAIALKVLREGSPVGRLVSRNTRELLRKYIAEGKLDAKIAQRKVIDEFVTMSHAERALYEDVERYIGSTWNNAKETERNAIGFVMTIYRRRLASSFAALTATLDGRVAAIRGATPMALSEDFVDDDARDEAMDDEEAATLAKAALGREEATEIQALLSAVRRLPLDTKAQVLLNTILRLREDGYPQVIVFTQFTDTLDFLRGEIAKEGLRVACFSGRGGEVMTASREWHTVSRDEVKRRFRRKEADVLVATDAAAEGLNFQFCGALINYDMPWNPMRVEQRIGRIDRLGQDFAEIRIVNLHYEDTIEADVYVALESRIGLFTKVIGKLQPILSSLPRRITDAALQGGPPRREDRMRLVEEIDHAISTGEKTGLDLDALTEADFPPLRKEQPAYDLGVLEAALSNARLLPKGWNATRLHAPGEWTLFRDGSAPLRVTVNPDLYEQDPRTYELWSAGSPIFPALGFGVDGSSTETPAAVLASLPTGRHRT